MKMQRLRCYSRKIGDQTGQKITVPNTIDSVRVEIIGWYLIWVNWVVRLTT
jgi:hypothetical protein